MSCTARTASHSAQGCGFRSSPSPPLVFTAVFNCLCLFLPSACPAPTAQPSSHCSGRLQLQQSTSPGHPIAFPCPSWGAPATQNLHWRFWGQRVHLCSGTSHRDGCPCPISLPLLAQFNAIPAQMKQMLPREHKDSQRETMDGKEYFLPH